MKIIISAIGVLIIAAGVWLLLSDRASAPTTENESDRMMVSEEASVPPPGTYTVRANESGIIWSGQKPLISGYVHRGTIGLSSGSITVGDNTASGTFVLDMNSIKVTSLGAGKDGRESALEGHLKAADFFDVATHPTATFTITGGEVISEAEHRYTIHGTLTMKGVDGNISFPATIFMEDGLLKARGTFQIDRTKWGITFGSGNFFSNLADNAIDDMISLELNLVAEASTI